MFGAGCFWGVQYNFDQLKGVIETEVGYAGGHTDKPTYKEVCTDKTGHAEVVHLQYDTSVVSYEELLKNFWENHDPTTMNRQGPDIGSQYRSIIFYYDEEQKRTAERSKEELGKSGEYMNPVRSLARDKVTSPQKDLGEATSYGMNKVVTEIVPASQFYKAEEYHQKYFEKTGQKVCH